MEATTALVFASPPPATKAGIQSYVATCLVGKQHRLALPAQPGTCPTACLPNQSPNHSHIFSNVSWLCYDSHSSNSVIDTHAVWGSIFHICSFDPFLLTLKPANLPQPFWALTESIQPPSNSYPLQQKYYAKTLPGKRVFLLPFPLSAGKFHKCCIQAFSLLE